MSARTPSRPGASGQSQPPAGADRGSHLARRASEPPPQLAEFDAPSRRLRLNFPCIADATTSQGFAALRRALPEAWTDALRRAWRALPVPSRDTPLREILARGTPRILPDAPTEVKLVTARRSALGRLCNALPSLPLHEVDGRVLDRLVRDYRRTRVDTSSAVTSADLTELRHTVNAARQGAGLPAIRQLRDAQPRRRQGRATERPIAGLDEVDRLLKTTSGWLQGLVLLRVVTTVPDTAGGTP